MKEGWEWKKLGEVCKVFAGGDVPKGNFSEHMSEQYNIPIYTNGERNKGLYGYTNINKVIEPSITISGRGTIGFCVLRENPFYPAIRLLVVTPKTEEINVRFLKYFFGKNNFRHSGTSIPQLTVPMIKDKLVPIPPLSEQQLIVEILDTAFAKIDTVKQNAERNLQNAKELFNTALSSYLTPKATWREDKLANCFKLTSGEYLSSKMMIEGQYLVYGGNGITGTHNKFNLSGLNIIIGRVGALCGNVRCIKENIWLTDNAFKITDIKYDFDLYFLTYQLNFIGLGKYARQTAQPVISNSSLKNISINIPPLSEQQQIVSKLDALSAKCKELENNYLQTINDCVELKKAILAKAFNGEL